MQRDKSKDTIQSKTHLVFLLVVLHDSSPQHGFLREIHRLQRNLTLPQALVPRVLIMIEDQHLQGPGPNVFWKHLEQKLFVELRAQRLFVYPGLNGLFAVGQDAEFAIGIGEGPGLARDEVLRLDEPHGEQPGVTAVIEHHVQRPDGVLLDTADGLLSPLVLSSRKIGKHCLCVLNSVFVKE